MLIIAEVSANHLGSLERALRIVDAAADAGADCVKFQTFTPEQMASPDLIVETDAWKGWKALELYRQAHTPRSWHAPLFARARERGLTPFASVFHPDDVDFLQTLGCPMYKIASFELTDLALIDYAAATGKPIIISTGMASSEEIKQAYLACLGYPTLLKCTSSYPAPLKDANLATITDLKKRFGPKVGLSDHTIGHTAAVVATALGATMIEKHLTLSRADGGLDAAFSAEPDEFAAMVKACREAESALGTIHYGPTASEADNVKLRRQPGGKRGEVA